MIKHLLVFTILILSNNANAADSEPTGTIATSLKYEEEPFFTQTGAIESCTEYTVTGQEIRISYKMWTEEAKEALIKIRNTMLNKKIFEIPVVYFASERRGAPAKINVDGNLYLDSRKKDSHKHWYNRANGQMVIHEIKNKNLPSVAAAVIRQYLSDDRETGQMIVHSIKNKNLPSVAVILEYLETKATQVPSAKNKLSVLVGNIILRPTANQTENIRAFTQLLKSEPNFLKGCCFSSYTMGLFLEGILDSFTQALAEDNMDILLHEIVALLQLDQEKLLDALIFLEMRHERILRTRRQIIHDVCLNTNLDCRLLPKAIFLILYTFRNESILPLKELENLAFILEKLECEMNSDLQEHISSEENQKNLHTLLIIMYREVRYFDTTDETEKQKDVVISILKFLKKYLIDQEKVIRTSIFGSHISINAILEAIEKHYNITIEDYQPLGIKSAAKIN